ncbi:baculoviral IAP repeat-containing protein 7 isoform X1 [Puntigrus tetrazona]|uniref:baculoviral IAP repeat-containing protein 7 isoform X1 n=1 Tax=Puntigrus tetrazona TaxID=1606681 RepID=UPI001C89688E|nr:baculoviral IAP repeat-containing protein 7 isoform X1 [Puntigrus tetrazona]
MSHPPSGEREKEGYMASGGGAEAHLNGPLWKESRMRGDRGHERERSARFGMRSEEERLKTFRNWPTDAPVSPSELARAGFHYLGYGDTVRCFCCDGVLRHWAHGDTPRGEHERHFPACGLMLGRDVGNVPLRSDSVDGQLLSQLQRLTVDEQVLSGQAVYPEMESEDSRLSTYRGWPTGASVQPDALAHAGFFYTGHGDSVKCFFCDGGLRNWEPGDDPWQEHAKWFPQCEYLLQSRGREYVSNIQQSYFNMNESVSGSSSSTAGNITSEVLGGQNSVAAGMLSPVVQAVLQMGFQRSLVESLVQSRYLLTGSHYTSVSDLVTDVLQAEEEERQPGEPRPETVGRQRTPRTQVSEREKVRSDLSPEEQLRQLQEERTCKVCMDKLVSMVFIPCGHLVVCTDCAASLRHCPICRAVIRGSVRAFMS